MKEFLNKKWTRGGLDPSLQKIDDVSSISRCTGSSRPRTMRIVDNVDAIADLVQSQEEQSSTHLSVRQTVREMSIPRSCVHDVIKQDLKLKCSTLMS